MAWSTTAVAGIWVTCFAALFLAVGFAIPFWFGVSVSSSDKTYNAYVGVWYAMACEKGKADSCKTEPIAPKFDFRNDTDLMITGDSQTDIVEITTLILERLVWWWVIQIVTTIGIGFVLLATLILICCRCAGIHSKGFFVISAILLFFGGVLSLVIAILTAIGLGVIFAFSKDSVKAETFPWSVLVFGIGGLLAIIASVIIMVVTCKWTKLGKYYESDSESIVDEGQQMSQLSKSYYDRPRKYESRYDDRKYDQSRDFSSSKKYRDGRDYSSRDYDQTYPSYDRAYEKGYEASYNRSYVPTGSYEAYTTSNGYSASRSGDNMYRPYSQYRY